MIVGPARAQRERAARLAVCACTVAGHFAGAVGLLVGSLELAALSLAVDAVDGSIARRLGASSRLGAALDFWGDVALCHLALWMVAGPFALSAMIAALLAQIAAWMAGVRVSGRALAFALWAAAIVTGT